LSAEGAPRAAPPRWPLVLRAAAFAVAIAVAVAVAGAGCAMNVSEARPARVLRGGEIQLAEVNDVVVPTRAVSGVIGGAREAAAAAGDRALTDDERRSLTGAAAAVSLTGPGYGAHIDLAVGLGYRYDVQARLGNGIYALSLRRGVDLGRLWHLALGVRGAYNTGQTFVQYASDVTEWVKLSETRRFDGQLFLQAGLEKGEWGRLWFGAKGMVSPLVTDIDTTRIGGDRERIRATLYHAGGFVGGAIGFRWFFFVAELTVLAASGHVRAFDQDYDLSGLVIAPSWGVMGTF
jgi:hypothetical protein